MQGNVISVRHAFGNSPHLQKSQEPNLLLIRCSISADRPGGVPRFYFLVLFNIMIQSFRESGIVPVPVYNVKGQGFDVPHFLWKTVIDTNLNLSQRTLAIRKILG